MLILKNIGVINNKIYSELEKADNTKKFISSLNQIVQIETENEYSKIPLSWYSLYIVSNLHSLNDEQSADDFIYLYKDLFKEVNDKIAFLNEKLFL